MQRKVSKMIKWAITTTVLYVFLALAIFVLPVAVMISGIAELLTGVQIPDVIENIKTDCQIFSVWQLFAFCCIILISEALLLVVPVRIVEKRPKPRRLIWIPVITTAFLFSIILLGIILLLATGIFGDAVATTVIAWTGICFVGVNWLIWSGVFFRFTHNCEPNSFTSRLMKWLLRGSIVELLIAIPSHIIARHREDCCAPTISFWGIVTGLVVMVIAFGPGIFFLFIERIKQKTTSQKKVFEKKTLP